MSSLKAAYLNELYKISKKKKIIVAAILSIAAIIVAGLIVSSINNFMGIRMSGTFSIMVLSVLNHTLIPLFTAFLCIDMFGGEFLDGTIKFTLTRPVTRLKVYLSKMLAVGTFILANLLFIMVLSFIFSLFVKGGGAGFFQIMLAHIASFFPLFVFALLVMVISNIVRGTTGAFLLTILIYLVFLGMQIGFSGYQSFFFTSLFDWYTLFLGSYINWNKIFRVLLIFIGFGTMLFGAGYYLFEKKQI